MTVQTMPAHDETAAPDARPVADDLLRRIERFYYREARLLDQEAYAVWLGLMDPDIRYWMPAMETRKRGDLRGGYTDGEMSYFDDDLAMLKVRVARYEQPSAWADNPATRHLHIITNIEAVETGTPGLVRAFSCFENVRNRNEKDQDIVHGRREDLLKIGEGAITVAERRILTVQNVLLSKNLNTFF
ncbi:3-phenylpropionate/cinnamic acid dioxygenase subunit beta (plasmid) [Tistrella bauzanensis]|uniref:3-phenylpropionate/cinnamic acid dioxygenase subunit beta n=1 Tax=Tistrella arctica TaxID=3133430 RepID=A0ABU9YLX1_9PROT